MEAELTVIVLSFQFSAKYRSRISARACLSISISFPSSRAQARIDRPAQNRPQRSQRNTLAGRSGPKGLLLNRPAGLRAKDAAAR